ncbi:MAG: SpoIIE family protein phosphatase [Verrucomicrobiota bacterium]
MKTLLSGLRFRLVMLVLIGGLPSLTLTFYTASEQRRHAATQVQQNALRIARLASAGQERAVEGARQLLQLMTHLPEVRGNDSAAAGSLLSNLRTQYSIYSNFGVIEMDGSVFASGLPMAAGINLADRAYFKRAVATREFAMGDYQIGRITGKAGVNFGQPILDSSGRVTRVVFASIDLSGMEKLAAEAELPTGGTLTVVDGAGTILARWPDPEKWRGQSLTSQPIWQSITRNQQGTAEAVGMDGLPKLFAFTQLRGAEGAGFVSVNIGIPTEVAFAEADRMLKRNLILLCLVGALAIAAAWFGGDWFILRRVNALVEATRRLECGELGARSGVPYGSGEIGTLAHAFDSMAVSLEQRGAERDRAEAELISLNAVLEQRVADRTMELREKNEQLESDLVLAREFQLALLPTNRHEFIAGKTMDGGSLRFCHTYKASGPVGGDFFDIFPLSDTQVGVVVCDVMGHGVRAALVMAIMRGLFEEFRPLALEPGKFITAINRELVRLLHGTHTTMFVTACYVVIDVAAGRLSYANAGHPWPLHLQRKDSTVESLRCGSRRAGPALGLFEIPAYPSDECPLAVGDALFLFTDGVFEITGEGQEEFGTERLGEAIASRSQQPTDQILEAVLAEGRAFSVTRDFEDDVCIVGIDLCGQVDSEAAFASVNGSPD